MPKNFVGESFSVSLFSGIGKFLVSTNFMGTRREGGREYHDFPSKSFCLTVPKNFVGEPFSVSLVSGISDKSQ